MRMTIALAVWIAALFVAEPSMACREARFLVSGLFGERASLKNRTQDYCEQDYPASGCHDREDQAASPRH